MRFLACLQVSQLSSRRRQAKEQAQWLQSNSHLASAAVFAAVSSSLSPSSSPSSASDQSLYNTHALSSAYIPTDKVEFADIEYAEGLAGLHSKFEEYVAKGFEHHELFETALKNVRPFVCDTLLFAGHVKFLNF